MAEKLEDLIAEAKAAEAAEKEAEGILKVANTTQALTIMPPDDDGGIVKVPSYRYENLLRAEFELTLIKRLIRSSTEPEKIKDASGEEFEALTIYELSFFTGLNAIAPDFYKTLTSRR